MSEKFQIRDMTVLDTDRQKVITINDKEKFKIKAPSPRERKEISRRIVIEQNGLPTDSFTRDDKFIFTRDAWINTLIVEHPEWWSNTEACLDEELKDTLYEKMLEWDREFQEKLKKNQFAKRGTES